MPELSHDTAEEAFHEIQLSGKQIVFLFMAVTVVSAVIFLCGVLVGRGVRAERAEAAGAEPVAAAEPAPAPEPTAEAGPPAAEPPSPPSEAADELSYHKRLQGEAEPQEDLKEEPAPAAAAAQPAATQPEPQRAAATAAPSRDAPAQGRPGSWIVQVTALRDVAAARNVVRDLAAKGFPAFLVEPGAGMPVIYRVQIGGYATRDEAEQVSRRIQREEQFKPQVRQVR